MCPDDNKQRNTTQDTAAPTTTSTSSPGRSTMMMMMITDPLSISISKPFLRSQSSELNARNLHQESFDTTKDDSINDDTLLTSSSIPSIQPKTSMIQNGGSTSYYNSKETTTTTTTNNNNNYNTNTKAQTTFALLRLIFCAVGICTCYICYGIYHEKLLRSGLTDTNDSNDDDDDDNKKNFMRPSFILFTQCITNVIVAMIWQQIQISIQQQQQRQRQSSSFSSSETTTIRTIIVTRKNKDRLPHRMLYITSLFYVCAMICSNEAIPHVSYPIAVLGKSCKLIPTMIIGQIISNVSKYLSTSTSQQTQMLQQIAHTRNEWIAAICICFGIILFHLQNPSITNHHQHHDDDASLSNAKNHNYGIFLLCTSLFMDGLLSVCQNILKQCKPRVPNAVETMYYINLYAVVFIGIFCYSTGQFHFLLSNSTTTTTTTITQPSSEYISTMIPTTWSILYYTTTTTIRPYLSLIQNLCILNIAAAFGQIFIFLTITWYTPVITTMITTTRKFITILLSVLLYGHTFTIIQWGCIVFIFFGLYIAIVGTTTKNSTSTTTPSAGITEHTTILKKIE